MRYVAAYLLANLGGNTSPSAGDIKKILDSVGVSVDDTKLEKVLSELKDKDINEVRHTLTYDYFIYVYIYICSFQLKLSFIPS